MPQTYSRDQKVKPMDNISFSELMQKGQRELAQEIQAAIEQDKARTERIENERAAYINAIMLAIMANLPECLRPYIVFADGENLRTGDPSPMVQIQAPDCAPIKINLYVGSGNGVYITNLDKSAPLTVAGLLARPPYQEGPYFLEYSWDSRQGTHNSNRLALALALAKSRAEEYAALEFSFKAKQAEYERQAQQKIAEVLTAPISATEEELLTDYDPLTRLRCALEDLVVEVLDCQLEKREAAHA
jgi:hypothetical protein